jgi:hypothetical protein
MKDMLYGSMPAMAPSVALEVLRLLKSSKAYEAWLGKMKDFQWVANVITLENLLGLQMNVSFRIQTVNVLPLELLETEDECVKALDFIQAGLRAKKAFTLKYFPCLHAVAETPSSSNGFVQHPCSRLDN